MFGIGRAGWRARYRTHNTPRDRDKNVIARPNIFAFRYSPGDIDRVDMLNWDLRLGDGPARKP
jgi:hypothetical protein